MEIKNKIDILIAKFLSGQISTKEANELNIWLNEYKENRSYFNQMLNIWQVANPAFNPEEINLLNAEAKVIRKVERGRFLKSPVLIWWQRIAAVLILPIILLGAYLLNNDTSFIAKETYQEVVSPLGTRSKVFLPDGSMVFLNSGSKIKYPVNFRSGARKVSLTGEAYFEVKSDINNPFIVKTSRLKVEATGTIFNVEEFLTDTIAAITLVEGVVGVTINGKKTISMAPNQRISLNKQTNKYQLTQTDSYKWYAWKDGVLAFRDDRLDYVFKKIGLMYNVDISVEDSQIASQIYRATFDGESLDEIFKLLQTSAPIRYVHAPRVMTPSGEFSKEKIRVYRK